MLANQVAEWLFVTVGDSGLWQWEQRTEAGALLDFSRSRARLLDCIRDAEAHGCPQYMTGEAHRKYIP
jgi:hypothetical protein